MVNSNKLRAWFVSFFSVLVKFKSFRLRPSLPLQPDNSIFFLGLADEPGRLQILEIHTKALRDNDLLSDDVDLKELAVQTKNFSGAEIAGLVRAAQSNAMNGFLKVRQ